MEPIFRGVVYLLDLGDNAQPSDQEIRSFSIGTPATHIVTTSDHYLRETSQGNGVIVTTEWVYSSVKAGVQRPPQYYSADPALFLSSFVLSTREIASSCMSREREQVIDNETDSRPGLVLLSIHSLRTSLARKECLQHPSDCVVEGQNVSVAHFYCHGLLSQNPAPIVANPTSPKGRPCLPYFPGEILTKIFLAYQADALAPQPMLPENMLYDIAVMLEGMSMEVPEMFRKPRPLRFDYMRAVLLLTHVCERWRSITHATADLWTDIQYDFHCEETRQRRLNLVTFCYPAARNPVVDFILENAHRIRALHLKLPEPHFPHLLQSPPGLFTALGSLTLEVIHECDTGFKSSSGLSRDLHFADRNFADGGPDEARDLWEEATMPFTVFQQTPLLREFALDAWAVFNIECMVDLVPWSNLTDIDFRFVTLGVEDMVDLLPRFTRVRRLELQMNGNQGIYMPALPRKITLPLVSLKWDGSNYVEDASVFTPLTLPSLKCLDLWYSTGAEGMRSLCARSACKLQSLSVHESYLSYPGFSKFLAEVPSLKSLNLYNAHDITDDFLRSLLFDSSTEFILPKLETLELDGVEQPMYSEKVMIKMVESRWKTTPLESVFVTPTFKRGNSRAHKAVHKGVISRMKRLADAGLKFNDRE
ncbi:hypothetical protein FB45DRAFT_1064483 [Roridomyces roridus]|uniref:Uncharacterized protein n=1 Tax=Roridomyces roridus TaxID=1738132 RepID=A0AAD7BA88_9AGAR|nr:hypothetical protein FB45DRAFT_1064483 [Roridomyces roridus]